jgi:hypothetical protein
MHRRWSVLAENTWHGLAAKRQIHFAVSSLYIHRRRLTEREEFMKETRTRALFLLIVVISGLVLCGNLTRGHDWGGDFAAYIMQAKSITEFAPRAFTEANRFTIEQSSLPLGPIAYPWGFPMLLAPFYALFGLNPVALKAVSVISYLLSLVVLWFAFRRVHTGSWFLCLVCLFGLNPTLLRYTNQILSDLPFLLVSTLCILLIQEVVVQDRRIISRLSGLVLIGTAVASASLIRTNGVLLLVTLGLSQLVSHIQRQSRNTHSPAISEGSRRITRKLSWVGRISTRTLVVQFAPYVVFLCLVTVWNWVLPEGGMSHVSYLESISVGMIKSNLSYYLDLPSDFFAGVPHQHLLYGASIPLVVAGAVRRYRSDYPAMIYIALTLLLYISWPVVQGIRFLFPILPFCLSLAFSGLEAFCQGASTAERGLRQAVCYLPVFLVILCFGLNDVRAVHRNSSDNGEIADGPFAPTSKEMFSFIANHTPSDSIVVFFKPRVMRLMTGRQSIMADNTEHIFRGDYLCLYPIAGAYDQLSDDEVEDLLVQGVIRMVYANRDFKVYRVSEDPGHFGNNASHTDGVYLCEYASVPELEKGFGKCLTFVNQQRLRPNLSCQTRAKLHLADLSCPTIA